MLRLVAWLKGRFAERGFSTERIATPGSPLLLAEQRGRAAGGAGGGTPSPNRTVLIYLQADGQPVDPSRWDQASPWEPVVKERVADGGWREVEWSRFERAVREGGGEALDPEWRIFARAASDSKGPVAQFLTAVSLLDAAGIEPAFHMNVIVDTEEELGSPHVPAAVARHGDRLAADMLVIFDGPPHVSGRPTLTFGARGIATATLTTYGARVPQHSGHYGNYLPNPVFDLSRILASARDERGRVTIPGWYDGVALDAETKRILAAVPEGPG
jgi:acetylornithine deacetylase/succinyl-diaminopimelate desuccinylase-like protein